MFICYKGLLFNWKFLRLVTSLVFLRSCTSAVVLQLVVYLLLTVLWRFVVDLLKHYIKFFNWTPPLYEHLVSVSVCSCIKNCAFLTPLLLYIFVVPLVHFSVPFYFQVGTTKICTSVCVCVCPFVHPTLEFCSWVLFVPPPLFVRFCSSPLWFLFFVQLGPACQLSSSLGQSLTLK